MGGVTGVAGPSSFLGGRALGVITLIYAYIFSTKPLNKCICNLMMPKLRGPNSLLCFEFIFCSNMFVSYHPCPYPRWVSNKPFCSVLQRLRPVLDITIGNKYTIEQRFSTFFLSIPTFDVTHPQLPSKTKGEPLF